MASVQLRWIQKLDTGGFYLQWEYTDDAGHTTSETATEEVPETPDEPQLPAETMAMVHDLVERVQRLILIERSGAAQVLMMLEGQLLTMMEGGSFIGSGAAAPTLQARTAAAAEQPAMPPAKAWRDTAMAPVEAQAEYERANAAEEAELAEAESTPAAVPSAEEFRELAQAETSERREAPEQEA